jgi:phospholipid N-methyltransferase
MIRKQKLIKTGKLLLNEINKRLTAATPQVVVEYNAGYGYITKRILAEMHPNSVLHALEKDMEKCKTLCEINDKRLRVRILPAEEVNKIVFYGTVDCVISSIPLTDYSNETITKIIKNSYDLLKNEGSLIQVMDTNNYLPLFQKYFQNCNTKVFLSIPNFCVYECKKIIIDSYI